MLQVCTASRVFSNMWKHVLRQEKNSLFFSSFVTCSAQLDNGLMEHRREVASAFHSSPAPSMTTLTVFNVFRASTAS